MSEAQTKDPRLSWQEQLAQVQGKVPEAKEVEVEVVSKEEATPAPVLPEAVPVVADAPKRHEKKVRKEPSPKPEAVPQPEVKAVAQPVEREERPIVSLRLGELRYIDLVCRVRRDKMDGYQVHLLLRKGSSTALFSLSYVGMRVRLCAREATGEFAVVFRKGTELFQDEIYGMKEVSPERLAGTTVFQQVLRFVEIKQHERRMQEAQVIPAAPADKRQAATRGKFGGHRQHRAPHDASK